MRHERGRPTESTTGAEESELAWLQIGLEIVENELG